VDVAIVESAPIVCDTGPHQGQQRVDFRGSAYLTGAEADGYPGRNGLTVVLRPGGLLVPSEVMDALYAALLRDAGSIPPEVFRRAQRALDDLCRAVSLTVPEDDPEGEVPDGAAN
jgi:hypothetical protein